LSIGRPAHAGASAKNILLHERHSQPSNRLEMIIGYFKDFGSSRNPEGILGHPDHQLSTARLTSPLLTIAAVFFRTTWG